MKTYLQPWWKIKATGLALLLALTLAACGDDETIIITDNDPFGSQVCLDVDRSPAPFDINADDEIAPAPPSIGADVPLTYFGPSPSQSNPRLIGPLQLLTAGTVNEVDGTITLPLYRGRLFGTGESVWYILTDTTDKENADALGLNFSAKLQYADAAGGGAVRTGRYVNVGGQAILEFDQGTVNFSPAHSVTPGAAPDFFPPAAFQPGSVGDTAYSPLVRIENAGGHVYNAPMVAFNLDETQLDFCDGNVDHTLVHDKVVAICPADQTVTLSLTPGFSFGRPVLYLSMEANDPVAASLEGATHSPAMATIAVGADDSAFSSVERIFLFVNGPTGLDNPQRQGLNSALSDGRGPLNVLGGIPTIATDYSPLWDVNLGEWTQAAIDNGYRSRLTEEFAILGFVERGWVTGPGGAPYGSTGIIVNCPIVSRLL